MRGKLGSGKEACVQIEYLFNIFLFIHHTLKKKNLGHSLQSDTNLSYQLSST